MFKKFLIELATIDGKEDDALLSIAINSYLTDKDFDIHKEQQLVADIQKIIIDKWDGDWNSFLDVVHRKTLVVTKTRIVEFTELKKLMKRFAKNDFFDDLYELRGHIKPERGKGEVVLAILFNNIKNAIKKGDVVAGKRSFEIKSSGKAGWRPIGNKQNTERVREYAVLRELIESFIKSNELDINPKKLMSNNSLSISTTKGSEFNKLFESVITLDADKQINFIKIMTQYLGIYQDLEISSKLAAMNKCTTVEEFRIMLMAVNIFTYIKAEKIESLGIWNMKNRSLLIISPKDLKSFSTVYDIVKKYDFNAIQGPDKRYFTFRVGF